MTKPNITFEPLPGYGNQKGADHTVIAEMLRGRPGEWAHILSFLTYNSSASTAYAIRNGKRKAWTPAGAFEAKARTVDGESRVYARYVGGAE